MTTIPESPLPQKPTLPPLLQTKFTRKAYALTHPPSYIKVSPFRPSRLPQLPPLYDARLAAVITGGPEVEDVYGTDKQIWTEEKYTLISLAERGNLYLRSKVMDKVQDLAPGPFKDMALVQTITASMGSIETLALLCCSYKFPPLECLPTNRVHNPEWRVKHAANMYLAYIGASRVPYTKDIQLGYDILARLDKYIDDLISPAVWTKLDDLVKQRSRGDKFGEHQLLNPAKRSLAERMWGNKVASTRPRSTSTSASQSDGRPSVPPSEFDGPSMLHSPAPRSGPLRSVSAPNGQMGANLPPRPATPEWDGHGDPDGDVFRDGTGPMRTGRRARGRGATIPKGPRAGQGGEGGRLSVR